MTRSKFSLREPFQRSKIAFNYLLDRIIEQCDLTLMDYHVLARPMARTVAHSIARGGGAVCDFLRTFPRLPAFKISGADWTIVFVGSDNGRQEICHLLSKNDADQQALGRIPLWSLARHTQRWLAEGAHLVVCELSRLRLGTPRAPITFRVPTWVQLELAIPEPPDDLISGRRRRGFANQIRRAEKSDFSHRFSQSTNDFHHFYHHMYVPFIKSRHGELALVTPYTDLLRWFKRGGLVQIMHKEQAVAGSICYMAGDICYWIESGVLEADPQLWQQGINTFQIWSKIIWGHAQGARILDMGGSHALRSDGSLGKKWQWGAKLAPRKRICREWVFLARDLPASLQEHINRLGFITPIAGKYYGVLVNGGSTAITQVDLQQQALTAKCDGLDGLAAILPDGRLEIYG